MKKLLGVLICLALIGPCFASQSYIETIYATQKNNAGVVRTLDGKNNKVVPVENSAGFTKQDLDRDGSFHDVQPKMQYDPVAESELMNEIHSLLNQSKPLSRVVISLKTRKVVSIKRVNGSPGTGLAVRTKGISDTNTSVDASKKTATTNISRNLTREEIRIRDAKRYMDILAKMGYEIEGGVVGEGGLWNLEQLQLLHHCIATLPVSFSRTTKTFRRVTNFMGRNSVMGYVFPGTPRVNICDWGVRPTKFEETIVHEMAHVWMFDEKNKAVKDSWAKTFWSSGKRPGTGEEQTTSLYGTTNVYEDFAESVRYYWQNCEKMRTSHPKRWEFIRKYVFDRTYWKSDRTVESTNTKLWAAKTPVQQ